MCKLLCLLAAIAAILAFAGCGPEKDPWEANLKAIPKGPRPGVSMGGGAPPPPPPADQKEGKTDEKTKTGGRSKMGAGAAAG